MKIRAVFPRSYRNCMKLIQEQYLDYRIKWHANLSNHSALFLIDQVKIIDKTLNIWVNIGLICIQSSDLEIFTSLLEKFQNIEKEKSLISNYLKIYQNLLYPELVSQHNSMFKDGDLLFSEYDYDQTTLASIEQSIRQSFSKYRLNITLRYEKSYKTSILGECTLGEALQFEVKRTKSISGKIILQMMTQQSSNKIFQISQSIKNALNDISIDLHIRFNKLSIVIDNGMETYNIGQQMGLSCLSGSSLITEL